MTLEQKIRYLGAIGTALAERRSDDEAISFLDRALALAKKTPDSGVSFCPCRWQGPSANQQEGLPRRIVAHR